MNFNVRYKCAKIKVVESLPLCGNAFVSTIMVKVYYIEPTLIHKHHNQDCHIDTFIHSDYSSKKCR